MPNTARGLLSGPAKGGRVPEYTAEHVVRLERIKRLEADGHTLLTNCEGASGGTLRVESIGCAHSSAVPEGIATIAALWMLRPMKRFVLPILLAAALQPPTPV